MHLHLFKPIAFYEHQTISWQCSCGFILMRVDSFSRLLFNIAHMQAVLVNLLEMQTYLPPEDEKLLNEKAWELYS